MLADPRSSCRSSRPVSIRRLAVVVCWCTLATLLASCTFLRNEFFVYDRAAPAVEEPSGADARW